MRPRCYSHAGPVQGYRIYLQIIDLLDGQH
jgi:hypothetical protein